jgi:hypothetical protein
MTVDATPPPFALAALAALRRARLRAIEVARATNTCLVVYGNGQIVWIPPHALPIESSLSKAVPRAFGVTVTPGIQRPHHDGHPRGVPCCDGQARGGYDARRALVGANASRPVARSSKLLARRRTTSIGSFAASDRIVSPLNGPTCLARSCFGCRLRSGCST